MYQPSNEIVVAVPSQNNGGGQAVAITGAWDENNDQIDITYTNPWNGNPYQLLFKEEGIGASWATLDYGGGLPAAGVLSVPLAGGMISRAKSYRFRLEVNDGQ